MPRKYKQDQIHRVLAAVRNGATTAREVAAHTGLGVTACASYLTVLRRRGLIQLDGRVKFGRSGRDAYRYVAVTKTRGS